MGEQSAALTSSRTLRDGPQFDEAVFADLAYRKINVDDVLGLALLDRRAAQAYLRSPLGS
jgi:hypothetical protein